MSRHNGMTIHEHIYIVTIRKGYNMQGLSSVVAVGHLRLRVRCQRMKAGKRSSQVAEDIGLIKFATATANRSAPRTWHTAVTISRLKESTVSNGLVRVAASS